MIPGLEKQGLTVEPRTFTNKLIEETNSKKAPSAPNSFGPGSGLESVRQHTRILVLMAPKCGKVELARVLHIASSLAV